MIRPVFRPLLTFICVSVVLGSASVVFAEDNSGQPDVTVNVTARRWVEPQQEVPGSVSVISARTIDSAGIQSVRDASHLVPNLTQPDFSVRWLSFPYVRGVGSGRNNPSVTTIIDGVPQLSYVTANQELLNVDHIEYLRGPQGSLYGRNALGGVINVIPKQPTEELSRSLTLAVNNRNLIETSGPMGKNALGSFSFGASTKPGYTTNDYSQKKLEKSDTIFGYGQMLWPNENGWNYRLSVTAERDNDGDYGLGDLAALQAKPYHVSHDFKGSSSRDLVQPVFTVTKQFKDIDFTSISSLQNWKTRDHTDADFSSAPLYTQGTNEEQKAYTQEFKLSSITAKSISSKASFKWLLGAFLYDSKVESDNFKEVLAGTPFTQHSKASLHNTGISPYGQVQFTWDNAFDLTLGLRYDQERRTAKLPTYFEPAIMPAAQVDGYRTFSQISPQLSIGYHTSPDRLLYASVTKGYKSGGFNAQAPAGKTSYGEETSWTYEAGVKTTTMNNRLLTDICVFRTDWESIQLDMPTLTPAVYYIDNAGRARSTGIETELTYRPKSDTELYAGMGYLNAEFRRGSQSAGMDVYGKKLPMAPTTTWHLGAQKTIKLSRDLRGFIRADVLGTGKYYYDASNAKSQTDYSLVNLRVGAEKADWKIEAFANNALDAKYVPVAFPVALPTVPSGYIGQNGPSRTIGISLSRSF